MAIPQSLSFGALLKRMRRAAGLTQEELAARAHFSANYLSMLERGTRSATRSTVELLADALQLSAPERARLLSALSRRLALPLSAPEPSAFPPHLVGRSHELALLDGLLTGQGPPALMLAGEPGIGKTRLLLEARQRARSGGWEVLVGGCQRRSGQEPYEPILSALARHLAQRPPAHQRLDLQGCGWLVRLLPELAETAVVPVPQWTLPPEQERRLMFAAVGRFLANSAGPAGVLLVLDDLQWAGADALDLLAALLHTAPAHAVRVLGAYRTTEVRPSDPLGLVLVDLEHEHLAARSTLGALDVTEAAELLDALVASTWAGTSTGASATAGADVDDLDPASDLRQRVLVRSEGVPLYLVSYAQRWLTSGDTSSAGREAVPGGAGGAEGMEVPRDVAEGMRQRVVALPEPARRVLEAAAIVGRVAPRYLLRTVGDAFGMSQETLVDALEAATAAGLLADVGVQAHTFTHDLFREAISLDMSSARRALLHRRVADALEQQPARHVQAGELAWHFAEGGEAARALPYALQAGDQAEAAYAHAEAERHFRSAVELARTLDDAPGRAQALEKLGAVLLTLARYVEALAALEEAADLCVGEGDVEAHGRVVAQIGRAFAGRGMSAAGVARLNAELNAAPGLSPQGMARIYLALSDLYVVETQLDDAFRACERAEAHARIANDQRLLARALCRRGVTLLEQVGQTEKGLEVLEEVIPLAEAAGDLQSLAGALNAVAESYKYSGQNARARPYYARAVAVAEQSGDPADLAFTLVTKGDNEYFAGDWKQEREDSERAETLLLALPVSWRTAYGLLTGIQDLLEGLWEPAERRLQEALAIAVRSGDLQAQRLIQWYLAERDLLEGRPGAARARLEPILDLADTAHGITEVLPMLAWAYLGLGNTARADEVVRTGLARARPDKRLTTVVDLLRVQALIQVHRRTWTEAEASLGESLAMARSMPLPYAEAKALYVSGQLHLANGEPQRARAHYAAALAILTRLGERLYAEHIERALTELGRTAPEVE